MPTKSLDPRLLVMPTLSMTIDEIISVAGGVGKLAGVAGVDHSTVSGWKRDGVIPAARAVLIHERLAIPLDSIPWRRPADASDVAAE